MGWRTQHCTGLHGRPAFRKFLDLTSVDPPVTSDHLELELLDMFIASCFSLACPG